MKTIKNENNLRMKLFGEAIKHQYPIAVYLNAEGEKPTDGVIIRNPMEMVDFVLLCYKTGVAENSIVRGFSKNDCNKLKSYLNTL